MNRWFPPINIQATHQLCMVVRIRGQFASVVGFAKTHAQASRIADHLFEYTSQDGDVFGAVPIRDDSDTPWWRNRFRLRKFLNDLAAKYTLKEEVRP